MPRQSLSRPGLLYLVSFGVYQKAGVTKDAGSYRWRMISYDSYAYDYALPFSILRVTPVKNMHTAERGLWKRWASFRVPSRHNPPTERFTLPEEEIAWFCSLPAADNLPPLHKPKYRLNPPGRLANFAP